MELRQSYIMSIARAKLSLYEQRLLIKCIQSGQPRIAGLPLGRIKEQLEHSYNAVEVEVPMREICEEGNEHYEYVKRAAQSLTQKNFTYVDEKGNWVTFSWVMRATHKVKSGKVYLLMDKRFYDCLFNFTKGYSHYDLERALNFKSPQAVKLYALLNGQKSPITYTIEALKRICGVEDKYKKTNDFVRKVLQPAYEEIKAGEYGNYFEYTYRKEGQKITGITFTPVQRALQSEIDAQPKSIRKWLPVDFFKILLQHGGFTTYQLNIHKETWEALAALPHGMEILLQVIHNARVRRPANLQGYIINGVKMELKAAKKDFHKMAQETK
ncbi:MAG: replication initiation protein [Prevotellamassilia sp.]|nr:replication initiation protein [Prevotellamassilia sp.]